MSFVYDDGWVAHVFIDNISMGRTAKLLLAKRMSEQSYAFVKVVGGELAFVEVAEGIRAPDDVGIELPVEAVAAIGRAIEKFQGDTGHAATEVRVLREWLKTEQDRVERVVGRVLDGGS